MLLYCLPLTYFISWGAGDQTQILKHQGQCSSLDLFTWLLLFICTCMNGMITSWNAASVCLHVKFYRHSHAALPQTCCFSFLICTVKWLPFLCCHGRAQGFKIMLANPRTCSKRHVFTVLGQGNWYQELECKFGGEWDWLLPLAHHGPPALPRSFSFEWE